MTRPLHRREQALGSPPAVRRLGKRSDAIVYGAAGVFFIALTIAIAVTFIADSDTSATLWLTLLGLLGFGTQDGDGGDPHLPHIKRASRPDEDPVAELAIRVNGLCAIYRHRCGREWLAARVHEHDPGLRLEQAPPRV